MKKNHFGFSLIELIVGVSISMILMISVGIFVSSGMKNITIQKQILDQSNEITNLSQDFHDIFSGNFEIISNTSTSIVIKSPYINGKPSYYEITQTSSTGYCQNDDTIVTKRLLIKNFNPFRLSSGVYTGSFLQHTMYSGSSLLAGKNIFGTFDFEDGALGSAIYLNNPAGLSNMGNLVFISDSGNNNILFLSGGMAYHLLTQKNGLISPTGILYNAGKLYILNSGKKELLELSSKSNTISPPISLSLSPNTSIPTVNQLKLEILPSSGFSINGTYSRTGFILGGHFNTNPSNTVSQSSNSIIYNMNPQPDLDTGDSIEIPSFSGTVSLNQPYYIKLTLLNTGTPQYVQYFPYVVNADNNLKTGGDNTVTVLTGGLQENYTDISLSGSNLVLTDFLKGEYLELSNTGNFISSGSIAPLSANDFENITTKSDFLIEDFGVKKTGNLLHIKLDYYKNFSCFNKKDSLLKSLIIKKVIPN